MTASPLAEPANGSTTQGRTPEPDEVSLKEEEQTTETPWDTPEPNDVLLDTAETHVLPDENEGTVNGSGEVSSLEQPSPAPALAPRSFHGDEPPDSVTPTREHKAESAEEFLEYDVDAEAEEKPHEIDKAKIVIEQSVHLPAVKTFDVIIPPMQSVSPAERTSSTAPPEQPVPREHWRLAKDEILHHLDELDGHVLSAKANLTGETSRFAAYRLRRHLANMTTAAALSPALSSGFGLDSVGQQQEFADIFGNLSLSIQKLNLTTTDAERSDGLVASARQAIRLARVIVSSLASLDSAASGWRAAAERVLFNARLIVLEVINAIRASSDRPALALGQADLLSWEWLLGRTSQRKYVFSRVFSGKPRSFSVTSSYSTGPPARTDRFAGPVRSTT